MADLEEVYAGTTTTQETQVEQGESVDTTGEESAPPAQETQTTEPEVDWRAKAEQAEKRAEEVERRAKGLEQAIAAARQKVREQPAPSFNEDPQAFVERVRQETQEQVRTIRVELSQNAARTKYADYDEKEQVFAELAQQNPLPDRAVAASNGPCGLCLPSGQVPHGNAGRRRLLRCPQGKAGRRSASRTASQVRQANRKPPKNPERGSWHRAHVGPGVHRPHLA